MISLDRDALICDLAETYGIFEFRALPVSLLATLSVGLRADSRIKMRLSDAKITRNEMLMAAIVDRLSLLVWAQTEDGRKNMNRPKSILSILLDDGQRDGNTATFETADEFESEWARITGVSHVR